MSSKNQIHTFCVFLERKNENKTYFSENYKWCFYTLISIFGRNVVNLIINRYKFMFSDSA